MDLAKTLLSEEILKNYYAVYSNSKEAYYYINGLITMAWLLNGITEIEKQDLYILNSKLYDTFKVSDRDE